MASLNQKSGTLGKRLAAHLLRRATYHVSPARIDNFANKTATQAVDELFLPTAPLYPNGPLYWENGNPIFSATDISQSQDIESFPTNTAIAFWRIYEASADTSIKWKLINWFSTLFNLYSSYRYNYYYWKMLDAMTSQNLKKLAYNMTLDNNMLSYLNNNTNSKDSPNENYAREFLELFTILKGEAIGVGNYTNYTEADISTAARVLTGLRNSNTTLDGETGVITGRAFSGNHDTANKTFSAAFGNTTITGASSASDMYRELDDFVTMVFDQQETARAYVRKMYRFFVLDNISAEVETDIIEPLATQLRNNGYQHEVVLKRLLKSEHFYDDDDNDSTNEIIGGKMKSPLEMFIVSTNLLDIQNTDTDLENLFGSPRQHNIHNEHFRNVGYDFRGPNTVEGYPGFYDAPGYSKNWFSANYIYERFTYGISFRRGRRRNTSGYIPYQCDMVQWVENNVDDPNGPGTVPAPVGAADATKLVDDMLTYLLPEMPTGDRYDYFENKLLGGLSPINWYFSWVEYLNTNDDSNVRVGIESLYDAIMSSPEFQTF